MEGVEAQNTDRGTTRATDRIACILENVRGAKWKRMVEILMEIEACSSLQEALQKICVNARLARFHSWCGLWRHGAEALEFLSQL